MWDPILSNNVANNKHRHPIPDEGTGDRRSARVVHYCHLPGCCADANGVPHQLETCLNDMVQMLLDLLGYALLSKPLSVLCSGGGRSRGPCEGPHGRSESLFRLGGRMGINLGSLDSGRHFTAPHTPR